MTTVTQVNVSGPNLIVPEQIIVPSAFAIIQDMYRCQLQIDVDGQTVDNVALLDTGANINLVEARLVPDNTVTKSRIEPDVSMRQKKIPSNQTHSPIKGEVKESHRNTPANIPVDWSLPVFTAAPLFSFSIKKYTRRSKGPPGHLSRSPAEDERETR